MRSKFDPAIHLGQKPGRVVRFEWSVFSWRTWLLAAAFLGLNQAFGQPQNSNKPLLLVLTDIGGDPDDIQSLRRLLVFANEFRLEGFIATATPKKGKVKIQDQYFIHDTIIHRAIDDYARVYPQLRKHAKGYPDPQRLRSSVFAGQSRRGVDNLEPGLSTSGSQHIINAVDASDERLHIAIWGGAHDLAQALLDVSTNRSVEELRTFIAKMRIYAINDQDNKFHPERKGTGEWIRTNFPSIWYIEAGPPWMNIFSACYRGMYQNDASGGEFETMPLVRPGIEKLNNKAWVKANVNAWGPLGAGYPAQVNQNLPTTRNTVGVKEGDTPSWFYFLPNGLSDPERPEWGCWGGRFEHDINEHYVDAQDNHWSGSMQSAVRRKWTVARWREAYQNDFAARMRWCILSYEEANHHPVAVIDGDRSHNVLQKEVETGTSLTLDASESTDPDGDAMNFKWWIYQEVSSSTAILVQKGDKAVIKTSALSPSGAIHVIVEVTDRGTPALTAYRRIVINVKE